jgi:peptidoglycan biosynthesis protein MviN/MurJ (putative lipid II flippase)
MGCGRTQTSAALIIIIIIIIINCNWVVSRCSGYFTVTEELLPHQTAGRQLIGWFIPQAALYSLMLLMMGKTVARNMSS